MTDSHLKKLLYQKDLLDCLDSISDFLEIINDYSIPIVRVHIVLNNTKKIKNKNPDYDLYSYIIYSLVGEGKS